MKNAITYTVRVKLHKAHDIGWAQKLDKHYMNLLDGRITTETYDAFALKLTTRKEELNDTLVKLTADDKEYLVTSSYLLDLANRVEELFHAGDYGQRNKLLKYLLYNLEFNDKKLSFAVYNPFKIVLDAKEKEPCGSETQIWCNI